MIYLVEDDDNIRKLVCYALSKDGHDVKDFPEPTSFWKEIHGWIGIISPVTFIPKLYGYYMADWA